MSVLRRILAGGVATGALGALLIAGSAQAASGDRAGCTFQGTGQFNPSPQLVGGSGTYSFSGLQFSCAVHRGTSVDVQQFAMSSTGTYFNVVCGTGTATSTAGSKGGNIRPITELGAHPPLADLSNVWWNDSNTHTLANQLDLSYTIQFSGGLGSLFFTSSGAGGVTGGGTVSMSCTAPDLWQGTVTLAVN